jgi:hypothetical protein
MIPIPRGGAFRQIAIPQAARGPREAQPDSAALWGAEFEKLLLTLPEGDQVFWGVPFELAAGDGLDRWLWLGPSTPLLRLALDQVTADHVVVAHFCLPSPSSADPRKPGAAWGKVVTPGELLGRYVLEFVDGTEAEMPIRRRFEVNDAWLDWGHAAFAARPYRPPVLLDWRGPHGDQQWGRNQQTSEGSPYGPWNGWQANYWIHAIQNPHPERPLAALRLEGVAGWIGIGGVTLFSGQDHPLRHGPLETLRITSTEALPGGGDGISVDLGLLGHRRSRVPTDAAGWLGADLVGWGEAPVQSPTDEIVVEVTASKAASLRVGDRVVPLAQVFDRGESTSPDGSVRVELLPPPRNWVRMRVIDAATGRPTPARVHVRAADGRYLPPYGHRHEVNDRWFEDYGADCLLGGTPYAYVSGEFDIELPTGDVYVEVAKGFDYRPVRTRVTIEAGQRELSVEIDRPAERRRAGWVTADTHVHFLSPQTAWLEGQAEDINVVNLLATQWGDLYTNVGDYTGSPSGVSGNDTIVWVGTENRQHFLGHMNLLGTRGDTVGRMCAGGPPESYFGDPVHSTLADWADRGRREGGLIVIPHFPAPYSEVVADVSLGKIDGVELRDFGAGIDSFAVREWYRLLNVGFRVAAVGGTDKMTAGMPLGGVRTYTRIGDAPLSFEGWAAAVRAGRTITSTGPFIDLRVEGAAIGDELRLKGNGGTLSVEAEASSFQPLGRLEIVHNGRVVASATPDADPRHIRLAANLQVEADGWIAARCDGPDTLWHIWPVRPAAHTSPVYLVGSGTTEPTPDLAYLQTIVEGGLTWLDTLATRADPATHRRLRQTFLDAQRILAGMARA